jgi:hypothetical protein
LSVRHQIALYNRVVGRRLMIRGVILLAALVAASTDAIALQFSMAAMACCAKTHNECAQLKTPDDCCRGMGHGVGASVSTGPDSGAIHFGLTPAVLPVVASIAAESRERFAPDPSTFKRPHDPPHLHPVALLI